jgi:hypothetical protein
MELQYKLEEMELAGKAVVVSAKKQMCFFQEWNCRQATNRQSVFCHVTPRALIGRKLNRA